MRRFFVVWAVCFTLVASWLPAQPAAAAGVSTLLDIKGHWAESYVSAAVTNGYVTGYPDGRFLPDNKVTKAEFLTMLFKAFFTGKSASPVSDSLKRSHPDLGGLHWYLKSPHADAHLLGDAITAWSVRDGQPVGLDAEITRGEVAAITMMVVNETSPLFAQRRELQRNEIAWTLKTWAGRFPDLSAWEKGHDGYLATEAVIQRLMSGYPDGSFQPAAGITRAEVTVVAERARKAPRPVETRLMDSGVFHTLTIDAGGHVWGWGARSHGQVDGLASWEQDVGVARVPGMAKVVAVAGGDGHSLALTLDGKVWAWGDNRGGSLGVNSQDQFVPPQVVPGLEDVVAIDAGEDLSMALTRAGKVYVWGKYQLQSGMPLAVSTQHQPKNYEVIARPTLVSGVPPIARLDAPAMITQDGQVWHWRPQAAVRALGLTNVLAASGTGLASGVVRQFDGSVLGMKWSNDRTSRYVSVPLPGVVAVRQLRPLYTALTQSGDVYAWGQIYMGEGDMLIGEYQLQRIEGLSDIVAISASYGRLYAIRKDGAVFGAPLNDRTTGSAYTTGALNFNVTATDQKPESVQVGAAPEGALAVTSHDRVMVHVAYRMITGQRYGCDAACDDQVTWVDKQISRRYILWAQLQSCRQWSDQLLPDAHYRYKVRGWPGVVEAVFALKDGSHLRVQIGTGMGKTAMYTVGHCAPVSDWDPSQFVTEKW